MLRRFSLLKEPIIAHVVALLVLAIGCLTGLFWYSRITDHRLSALATIRDQYRTICDVSLIVTKNVSKIQVGFQNILLADFYGELEHATGLINESMETVRRASHFLEQGGRFVETYTVNFDGLDQVEHEFKLETTLPDLRIASMELRTSLSLLERMQEEYRIFAIARLDGYDEAASRPSQLMLMHKKLAPFFTRFQEHAYRFYVQSMNKLTLTEAQVLQQKIDRDRTVLTLSAVILLALLLTGTLIVRSAAQILGKRQMAEDELRWHGELLQAVASAIHTLLSQKDFSVALPAALEQVARVARQDRVYLFELHRDPASGEALMSQRYEWVQEGISPQIDNPELQAFPLERMLPRWYEALRRCEVVAGAVRTLPEAEKPFFQDQGIVSLMVAPVMVDDILWGTLGFDNCHSESSWQGNELAILTSLAVSLGAAIQRHQAETALLTANRKLEAANDQSRLLAAQATSANRAKGLFLANMSHEIRTPMNAIIGMTHLAMQARSDDQRQRFLETVQHASESLLGLLNDILDFSKMEAGQLQLNPTPFNLRRLLHGIVSTMGVPATEKGLALTVDIADQLPEVLTGDDMRLRQILLNLVGNAIKFTSQGSITISVAPEMVGTQEAIHCTVIDTGIGIPADKCTSIFNSFEQADSSHARHFGGTGLGLSICSQLVDLMGGRIWAESREQIGSAFHFIVPLPASSEQPAELPEIEQAAPMPMTSLRILVVDDNAVNRDVASMTLEETHEVVTAGNGLEALTLLARHPFDLVLMDVQMPEMDGLTATAMIRALEQEQPLPRSLPQALHRDLAARLGGGHVPIVAMTAHAMGEDREMCLAAGMDGYITKPFQPAQLVTILHELMAGNVQRHPHREREEHPAGPSSPNVPILPPMEEQVATHLQTTTGLGAEQIDRLLIAVRQSLTGNLARMEQALLAADASSLAAAAHALKGTLLQCGLQELAGTVEAVEHQAKALRLDNCAAPFQVVRTGLADWVAATNNDHQKI